MVLDTGTVVCWGHGYLGNGTTESANPVAVAGINGVGTLGGVAEVVSGNGRGVLRAVGFWQRSVLG